MLKRILFILLFMFSASYGYAKDLTILYTGETHAMLYPCSCPIEPDGGLARRASLVRQLRQQGQNLLLLDSGAFFAGGLMDEYAQNSELDMKRTEINLKTMELMGYDAVAISDDEFNFGKEYLRESVNKAKINFLSCNISLADYVGDANWFKPYIIKEYPELKVGIIGVSNEAILSKIDGVKFIDPKKAVQETVEDLKNKGVDIIVLLSQLGEAQDLGIIETIPGIDILIVTGVHSKEGPWSKKGRTLILRPSWQGRRLGKAVLTVKNKKIANYKVEEIRVSDKVKDDAQVSSILPACFTDNNCKKEGMAGICKNPGSLKSACSFSPSNKVSLLVITKKDCSFCDTKTVIEALKKEFAGLTASFEYYPSANSEKLVKDFAIKGLPAYLLSREAVNENGFSRLKDKVELKGDYYLIKPEFVGVSYFIDRIKTRGKLDLFISLYDKKAQVPILLANIKDFKPEIHFLATENNNQFSSPAGNLEVEDYLRSVCVKKYYPDKFWDYIVCRSKNSDSSWWQDCLGELDSKKIATCARTDEGKVLLEENISLNKELDVMFGPVYLLDNQEIFGIEGAPKKEDYKKIFKR